jgi:hypothetical protein
MEGYNALAKSPRSLPVTRGNACLEATKSTMAAKYVGVLRLDPDRAKANHGQKKMSVTVIKFCQHRRYQYAR